jgi:hypothetical protein
VLFFRYISSGTECFSTNAQALYVLIFKCEFSDIERERERERESEKISLALEPTLSYERMILVPLDDTAILYSQLL